MRRAFAFMAASLGASALLLVAAAQAGRENVAFPDFRRHVLYAVLDQPDSGTVREAYIDPEALKNYRLGGQFPSGTVLTMPVFRARVDENGRFVRDANGRLVSGTLERILVMEKRTGWGIDYPDSLRNGEWEYELFRADGSRDTAARIEACFACHKPFEKIDFVFTIHEIARFKRP